MMKQIARNLWNVMRGISAIVKTGRVAREQTIREAERLDRIRNPHKYQGR